MAKVIYTEWFKPGARFLATETYDADVNLERTLAKYSDGDEMPEWEEVVPRDAIFAETADDKKVLAHLREAIDDDAPDWIREIAARSGVVEQVVTHAVKLLDDGRVAKLVLVGEGDIASYLSSRSMPVAKVLEWLEPEQGEQRGTLLMKRYPTTAREVLMAMKKGPDRARTALLIVAHTLRALALIKASVDTFVHGDLHPGNIFIENVPAEPSDAFPVPLEPLSTGRVVLGNFGRSTLSYTRVTQTQGNLAQELTTHVASPGLVLSRAADINQLIDKTTQLVPETDEHLDPLGNFTTDTAAQTAGLMAYVAAQLK